METDIILIHKSVYYVKSAKINNDLFLIYYFNVYLCSEIVRSLLKNNDFSDIIIINVFHAVFISP